jgi:hypothetical protein
MIWLLSGGTSESFDAALRGGDERERVINRTNGFGGGQGDVVSQACQEGQIFLWIKPFAALSKQFSHRELGRLGFSSQAIFLSLAHEHRDLDRYCRHSASS